MAKIIFKDNTTKLVDRKQLSFILGIKDIRKQVFTYMYL